MTNAETIVDILNELLAAEQQNLASRLMESTVFISRFFLEDVGTVKELVRTSEEHSTWLAEAVIRLDGVPGPRASDPRSADLHFQELHHVLHRLVEDREALVRKYALALERLDEETRAADIIQRILTRHQEALRMLRRPAGENVGMAD